LFSQTGVADRVEELAVLIKCQEYRGLTCDIQDISEIRGTTSGAFSIHRSNENVCVNTGCSEDDSILGYCAV
jgi:hypothetical protein